MKQIMKIIFKRKSGRNKRASFSFSLRVMLWVLRFLIESNAFQHSISENFTMTYSGYRFFIGTIFSGFGTEFRE